MFFWHVTSKKRKKSRFLDIEKNEKNVFSNYAYVISWSTNVTDGQTDRQTTCDRNTALWTEVHRAVKIVGEFMELFLELFSAVTQVLLQIFLRILLLYSCYTSTIQSIAALKGDIGPI